LFKGVCPSTPKLVAAYGKRVSEICEHAVDKTSSKFSNSIFSTYSEIDGASIWAVATSSKATIHVHLLANMLARFWELSETISIWG
jgi:hypothetical protein